ncbi:hypothetical protein ABT024_06000 [Streptomyces sp. NPDC002812]|uniref:hypothetical protein n=1 Tax=Streptomyces sp. NPDC002812 TaxID=3154434 RepID=UPI00332EF373
MRSVFPYRVLSGEVQMEVDKLFIDHIPAAYDAYISSDHKVVALQELIVTNEKWQEVLLNVSVTVNPEELAGGPWQDTVVVATADNRRANVHSVFRLSPDGAGRWTGQVHLPRGEHCGHTELSAHVVATVDGVEGRLIGTALDPWAIRFDSRTPVADRVLPMQWVDFEERKGFESYAGDPWLLGFDAGEPTLYLNSGFDGLRKALERSGTPEQRILGEVLGSQITSEVWTSLFNSAVHAAEMGPDGAAEWPGGWHGDVLRMLLPEMYPTELPEKKLTDLVEERIAGGSGTALQMRLGHGAGRHAQRTRKLSAGLRDLEKLASKKERA